MSGEDDSTIGTGDWDRSRELRGSTKIGYDVGAGVGSTRVKLPECEM
jgi:hypothetical protein